MRKQIMKIYSDGGARGNPGPAASAFVVIENGKVIHKDASYLGERTNNEAEYEALLMALRWLNKNKESVAESRVRFFLDSELLVRQLNGNYKVKSKNLKPLFEKALALTQKLDNKKFIFIRREKNKLADSLVNLKIDEVLNKN